MTRGEASYLWQGPEEEGPLARVRGEGERMEVQEIMTGNPEYAEVSDPVRTVFLKLVEIDVRHLPIVDEGELVGMISDRDLRGFILPMASELETVNTADARFERAISDLMQGDVISVSPSTEVGEVIDLMIDQRVGAIPVVDPVNGTLMGIVSYVDVIREARGFFG